MKRDRKLLAGAAVSLLLHAGLLFTLNAPTHKEPLPDARRMMVWLMPKPLAAPVPPPALIPPDATILPRRMRKPPPTDMAITPPQPPATREAPAAAPSTEAVNIAQKPVDIQPDPFASPSASVKGKFDVNAAMKSARKLATAKSTKDDPPVAQIYDKPLYGMPSDTPLGTAVARTARADCKTAAAGTGILALIIIPAMILTDKKDSGCKW